MTPLPTTTSTVGAVRVPEGTDAFLWDMDGVLLDTLTLDFDVVGDLLHRHVPNHPGVSRDYIRSIFAYDPPEFFRRILGRAECDVSPQALSDLLVEYEAIRRNATPPCNPGIHELLGAARAAGIRSAVVSNNPEADVRTMLTNAGIIALFDEIVGNDRPGTRKKPAPDSYLAAASCLDVHPSHAVVFEDSILGLEAGKAAGCFTIGVATGSASLPELHASGLADLVYSSFAGDDQS